MTFDFRELVETAFVCNIVDVTHRAAGGSRVLALSGTFSTLTAAFDILIASTGVTHRAAGGTRLLAFSAAADFDRFADIARRVAGGTCLLHSAAPSHWQHTLTSKQVQQESQGSCFHQHDRVSSFFSQQA